MYLSDFYFFIFHDANYIGSSPVVLRTSCKTLRLQDKLIAGLSSFTVSTVAAISLSSAFLDTWQGVVLSHLCLRSYQSQNVDLRHQLKKCASYRKELLL